MDLLGRLQAVTGRDRATTLGILLSVLWVMLVVLFWALGPDAAAASSGIVRLGAVIGVMTPLALIWLAVGLAQTIAALRHEADDLRARLAMMRRADGDLTEEPAAQPKSKPAPAPTAVAKPAPPPARPQPAPDTRQTALRFDAPDSISVSMDDFVLAANFPNGPDDRETIAALRSALRDHDAARVLRAGQDVITLLAAAGIYMDHLQPGSPDLNLWHRFAEGVRGDAIGPMGAIHDEDALDRASDLLKRDEIFRDAAHHFMRYFDVALTRWVPGLTDGQLLQLTDSRSSRAFMLLGRVVGIFG